MRISLKGIRQFIIIVFCVFHFTSIAWWTFPHSYWDYISEQTPNKGFVSDFEHRFFQWFEMHQNYRLFQYFTDYIDLIGAYQYWDFFAPVSPRTIHFLTVCTKISMRPELHRIDCNGNVLFKSYNGTLEDALHSHDGKRSRSFRFTENFINFDDHFQNLFINYWSQKNRELNGSEHIYVIDHQFQIKTDDTGIPRELERIDQLISTIRSTTNQHN